MVHPKEGLRSDRDPKRESEKLDVWLCTGLVQECKIFPSSREQIVNAIRLVGRCLIANEEDTDSASSSHLCQSRRSRSGEEEPMIVSRFGIGSLSCHRAKSGSRRGCGKDEDTHDS